MLTKADLYHNIDLLRAKASVDIKSYPLNASRLAKKLGCSVYLRHFVSEGLRGLAVIEDRAIFIDEGISAARQNYYCAHELYHLEFHHEPGRSAFQCYDGPFLQDDYIEWQANEGAAELLVPYRIFLPTLKKYSGCFANDRDFRKFRIYLAREFRVGVSTIEHRFNSLKYEIDQYMTGRPLNDIEIMSGSCQQRCGIKSTSYNDIYLNRLPAKNTQHTLH